MCIRGRFRKWQLPLLVVISLIGSILISYLTRKPVNSLGVIVLVGFIWLSGYKRKLACALSLVVIYTTLAIPLILAGWMDASVWHTVLIGAGAMLLGLWTYRLKNLLSVLVAVAIFCGGALALYALQLIGDADLLIIIVGALAAPVGWSLFRPKSAM